MPERNVIQRPEILRRITRELGMRQAHVAPTLNEGIQAVVIAEDLTQVGSREVFRNTRGRQLRVSALTQQQHFTLRNPVGSGVVLYPRKLILQHAVGVGANVQVILGMTTIAGETFIPSLTWYTDAKTGVGLAAGENRTKGIIAAVVFATPSATLFLGEFRIDPPPNRLEIDLTDFQIYEGFYLLIVPAEEGGDTWVCNWEWAERPTPVLNF